MKIALIGPTYPFRGGISHYTTLLYKHLRRRHKVHFFAFKRQYPQWFFPGKSDIDTSQARIQEEWVEPVLDSLNPLSWLKVTRKIMKVKPDLVIFPWWVSFWTPQFCTISTLLKRMASTKTLFLCHNVVQHESRPIDKWLTHLVFTQGDYFVVHSLEDQNKLLSMIPDAKVKRTFHPTYDIFKYSHNDECGLREALGIEDPLILFFGFVREYKGLRYLIESLPSVLSRQPLKLMIVGEFWKDKEEYVRLIRNLGLSKKVILIDEYVPNEEVGKYFSAADLVVQPYISATGSGIIQIAFAFHKPVIATRVGCLPEVVEDGKTGYLVSPKSSLEIADAIVKFFEKNQAVEFSENIKKVNYKFSWNRLIDVIEELCRH